MRNWNVTTPDGVNHTIQYKAGFGGPKVVVDGTAYKAKSSNWFINIVDYAINFGSFECRLVVIGNKMDLAINGVYQGSGKPYEPVNNVPSWIWVLVGFSVIGGWFFCGLFGLLLGVIFSSVYIRLALEKKTGALIGSVIGFLAVLVVLFLLSLSLQLAI